MAEGRSTDRLLDEQLAYDRARPSYDGGLSHVPHVPLERFETFWDVVDACLAPGGRVLFVDTGPGEVRPVGEHFFVGSGGRA